MIKNDQLDFGDLSKGSEQTRRESYNEIKSTSGFVTERVFDCIKGDAGTCEEIEKRCGWSHQTVSSAIVRLERAGRICERGDMRKNKSGRNAVVWMATPENSIPQIRIPRGGKNVKLLKLKQHIIKKYHGPNGENWMGPQTKDILSEIDRLVTEGDE